MDPWVRSRTIFRRFAAAGARIASPALLALVVLTVASRASANAPSPDDDRIGALAKQLEALRSSYEARISTLEREIRDLKRAGAPASGPAPSAPGTAVAATPGAPAMEPAAPVGAPTAPVTGAAQAVTEPPSPLTDTAQAATEPSPPLTEAAQTVTEPTAPAVASPSQTSNYFNPSISVIGNFFAVGGTNTTENLPSASLRESELGLQAIVDPYARADFFLSFGEEGVDVEEGIVTFTSLPWGLLTKVGRMRANFGKTNTLHLHVLPWPDEPLPIVNLLGGEEGWIGTGASTAKIIPLPGDTFSEASVQLFSGDAGELFSAPSRSDLSYNARYRIFRDLSDATNLDLGLSYGAGPNGITPRSDTRLEGVDLTLRWKPLQTASYRSATLRGEWIRSRLEGSDTIETADGWFVSGEYQLAKRWYLGARYERSELAFDAGLHDSGYAALLTFWPSEFSQIRPELRRRIYANGETADELLLQIQFAIGAHGAHPF